MEQYFKDPKIEHLGTSRDFRDYNGCLLMFESPKKDFEYFVGADIGGGLGLSNSVAHILRAGTINEPDVQVAEFASNFLSPTEFSHVLNSLGHLYYNHLMELPACLNVENNNYGHTVLANLVEHLDYINLFQDIDPTKIKRPASVSWGTGVFDKTRTQLVMLGEARLKTGQWQIWSPGFLEEMADFQITNIKHVDALSKEIMATAGKWEGKVLDDRLFAGFHALWACNAMNPDLLLDRERLRQRKEAADQQPEGDKPDYRNTAISYDGMMADLDSRF